MTYAHRQDIFDADSHMMEPADWLARFAAPAVREALAPYLEGDNHAHERLAAAEQARQARKIDPTLAQSADEAFMSMRYKGFEALGAWDREERRHVNDLLGFQESLMFPYDSFQSGPRQPIGNGLSRRRDGPKPWPCPLLRKRSPPSRIGLYPAGRRSPKGP